MVTLKKGSGKEPPPAEAAKPEDSAILAAAVEAGRLGCLVTRSSQAQ